MSKKLKGMDFLRHRMSVVGYKSLEEVAVNVGINRGNLYRYFTLETAPSIAMVNPLARTLKVCANDILSALDCPAPERKG